jgi:hypothetical protein
MFRSWSENSGAGPTDKYTYYANQQTNEQTEEKKKKKERKEGKK